MNKIPVGAILKEYGFVTEEQIEEAASWQRRHKGSRFDEALIAMGFITEQQLLSALGQKMGMEVISAAVWPIDEKAVERIPYPIAKKNNLIAIGFEEETLVVAVDDPLNFYAAEEVNLAVDGPVRYVLSPKEEIAKAIEDYYAEIEARLAASAANAAAMDKEEDPMDSFLEGDLEEGDPESGEYQAYESLRTKGEIDLYGAGTIIMPKKNGPFALLLTYYEGDVQALEKAFGEFGQEN